MNWSLTPISLTSVSRRGYCSKQAADRHFTKDQLGYLHLIRDRIAGSLTVAPADLQNLPFSTHGGLSKARQLFGNDLNPLLEELTQALAA